MIGSACPRCPAPAVPAEKIFEKTPFELPAKLLLSKVRSMTDVKEITEAVQEQVLSALKVSQTAIVEGVRTFTDTVGSVTPESLKTEAIPGLDTLPDPKELMDASFGFAEALLNTQKEFAQNLLAAAAPNGSAAPKAAAKKS